MTEAWTITGNMLGGEHAPWQKGVFTQDAL